MYRFSFSPFLLLPFFRSFCSFFILFSLSPLLIYFYSIKHSAFPIFHPSFWIFPLPLVLLIFLISPLFFLTLPFTSPFASHPHLRTSSFRHAPANWVPLYPRHLISTPEKNTILPLTTAHKYNRLTSPYPRLCVGGPFFNLFFFPVYTFLFSLSLSSPLSPSHFATNQQTSVIARFLFSWKTRWKRARKGLGGVGKKEGGKREREDAEEVE